MSNPTSPSESDLNEISRRINAECQKTYALRPLSRFNRKIYWNVRKLETQELSILGSSLFVIGCSAAVMIFSTLFVQGILGAVSLVSFVFSYSYLKWYSDMLDFYRKEPLTPELLAFVRDQIKHLPDVCTYVNVSLSYGQLMTHMLIDWEIHKQIKSQSDFETRSRDQERKDVLLAAQEQAFTGDVK